MHPEGVDRGDHGVVVLSVGAAKQRRPRAGDGFDLVGAGVDLRLDLLGAELRHVRVRARVVHDLVARVRERLDRLRIFVHPLADDEKRRVYVVFAEDVDERLRVLVAPRRVERQAHDAVVALHTVDGQHALGRAHAHDRGTVHRPEHERDGQHREQDHDNGHDLDRPEPQPVHAGVDDADRDEAEHAPVLDARALVDQIVPRSAQRQYQTAAPALREVVAQRVEFFLGQVGMLAQLREEVIDRLVAVVAAVEHDAPVRIDDIAVSRAAEGGIVERVQHRVVIVGDGDRVVGEAAIGSLRLRAGEHEHLRLSGQRRVQHDVLSGGKRPVQVAL